LLAWHGTLGGVTADIFELTGDTSGRMQNGT
jgi:hypothetical protein